MNKHEALQALIDWEGDTASLILEMKRRAGVRTDSELAAVIGRTQGAISHWKRNGVPKPILLGFEEAIGQRQGEDTARALAARAIAIRLAGFMHEQNVEKAPNAGRWVPHMTVALGFHSITDAIYLSLAGLEDGASPLELAELILEDRKYLGGLADWVRSLPIGAALAREAKSPPSIPPAPVPQLVPQSAARRGRKG